MISGPSWMQILIGCGVGRPIVHTSHRPTNLYFSASLQPIEWESSVIITGKFWDALPLLGYFQNGRHKKIYEKLKIGYSIPQLLIITGTQTLSLNICFWECKIWSNYSKIVSRSRKGSKSKMAANFGTIFVLDIKSTRVLFLIMT